MTYESAFFAVSVDNGVASLELNRPEKANAMSPDFWADLPRLIGAMDRDPAVRCAVLTGAGEHFTSGMDLSAFAGLMDLKTKEPGRAALELRQTILDLQESLSCIERARFPVIAAIHGACVGGGVDLTSAVDIRYAGADAFFAVEEINIGMAADVGTLQRLPKIVPPGIAAELCLTGRRFGAAEAKEIGFVDALHSDRDATIAAARRTACAIAARSPLAVAGVKRALIFARDHSVADGLERIATWNGGMLRPEDLQEAMRARMTKEPGDFKDLG